MNNLLRKITAGILSATMVLSGLGTFPTAMSDLFSYAGGGGGESSVNRDAQTAQWSNDGDKYSDYTGCSYYLLDISTGMYSGESLKDIIIEYEDDLGVTRKQVLMPNKKDYPTSQTKTKNLSGNNTEKMSYIYDAAYYPYIGSKFTSYSLLVDTESTKDYIEGAFAGPLATRIWSDFPVTMSADYKEKYPNVSDILTKNYFNAYTSEQILFKVDRKISTLKSVSFFCEAEGMDQWSVNGWQLYSIPDISKLSITAAAYITGVVNIDYEGTLLAGSDGAHILDFVNYGMFVYRSPSATKADHEYSFKTYNNIIAATGYNKILNFSINLADSYGAGIESFNKIKGEELSLTEMLDAKICYTDTNGVERYITVPVISNAVADYTIGDDAYYKSFIDDLGDMLSYAQQGESIVFSVRFEDYQSLNSLELVYNNSVDKEDSILVESIDVYDNWGKTDDVKRDSVTRYYYEEGKTPVTIDCAITNRTPIFTSSYVAGGTLLEQADNTKTFTFVSPDKATTPETDYSNTYLIEIKTSDVNFADTTDDILVTFSYTAIDGTTKQTEEYSLQEKCKEYYGYNPGVDENGNIVDGNYCYCMRQGGTLRFLAEIKNLDTFTGMTVAMASGATDDWQMDSVTVYRANNVGRRTVTALEETEYGGITINRCYERSANLKQEYSSTAKVYIQQDQEEEVDLDSGTYTSSTEKRDMSEYYYSMDYEVATSDLHIDQVAWDYKVTVNVQKNEKAGTESDDCGSENLFYFQLVFERGTSGYVLANQQLTNDCFRAGEPATFYVSINEDMGELTAVNILPDDVSQDCKPLDKLCIDNIEIIKNNPDSANKCYECNNVGWIDLEYIDNDEETDKEGRYAGDIVKSFPVSTSYYMLSFEFAIGIDTYTDSSGVKGDQFEGGMQYTIVYYTDSGERKKVEGDLVKAMYDYANHTGTSSQDYGYESDPDYMFRENGYARFIVNINDAKTFSSITISGKPKTNCQLNISSISVQLLNSEGSVYINSDGEFQRKYTKDPDFITDEITGRNLPHRFTFTAGTYSNYTFNFGENEVPELEDGITSVSTVTRVPQSYNDTLNLFIYLAEGVKSPAEGNYTLKAKIAYSSASTENTYVNETTNFTTKADGTRVVLSAKGLSATNISMITNLKLTTPDLYDSNMVKVDYAIIQQVRNGVVINTYKIRFSSKTVSMDNGVTMMSKETASMLGYSQKVSLLLGEGTEKAKLVPEEYDIALAIRYMTTNDTDVLKSAYVYASDNDILSLQEGSIVEFYFNEAYVDQIVDVEVIGLNGLEAVVEAGNVVCSYTDDDGKVSTTGCFSMDVPTEISQGGTTLTITSDKADDYNSLKRAKFTFTTMKESTTVDSGGTASIKMVIGYKNYLNQCSEKVIEDIRDCAIGGFGAGEEATVEFFISGAKALYYVELIPNDEDPNTTAKWNLESLDFSLEGGEDTSEHSVKVSRTLTETTESYTTSGDVSNYINVSLMEMTLNRSVNDVKTVDKSEEQTINVAAGSSFALRVGLDGGTSETYGYIYDNITGGNVVNITPYTENYGKLEYQFDNTTGETQVYRFTIFAKENPAVKTVLTVNVAPEKIEEDIPEDQPADIPDSNTDPVTGGEGGSGEETPTDTPTGESGETGALPGETNVGSAQKGSTKKKEEDEADA